MTLTQILQKTLVKPRGNLTKVVTKNRKQSGGQEEECASSSNIEKEVEAAPKPKKRLVKKGPTFTQALQTKRTKLSIEAPSPKQSTASITIREPALEPTRTEKITKAK